MGIRKNKPPSFVPIEVPPLVYGDFNSIEESPIKSPYEGSYAPATFKTTPERGKYVEQTIGANKIRPSSKKRHSRGSHARHTLGVDVTWLKRLVVNRSISDENRIGDGDHSQRIGACDEVLAMETPIKSKVNGAVKNPSNLPLNGHHHPNDFDRSASNNFSLKKLKTFIKQTRSAVNSSLTAKPCHSTPILPRSSVILGISALKTPPSTSRLPASTRV